MVVGGGDAGSGGCVGAEHEHWDMVGARAFVRYDDQCEPALLVVRPGGDDGNPAGQPVVRGGRGAVVAVVAVVRRHRGVCRQRAVDNVVSQVSAGGGPRWDVPGPAVGQVGVV